MLKCLLFFLKAHCPFGDLFKSPENIMKKIYGDAGLATFVTVKVAVLISDY